ncbi:MAG: hypothetical protein IJH39_08485 [Clostridia bacterium]|nr:hypothetical protein [Clostridia bacterium]
MVERDIFTGELKLDTKEKITFGKYQGRTLSSIMITDPSYLVWVVNESDMKNRISDTWKQYLEDYSYTMSKKQYATYMR